MDTPTATQFEIALSNFIAGAQRKLDEAYGPNYPENCKEVLVAVPGKRYTKVVRARKEGGEHGSVYCFIDQNGDILKPASWRAPAKHARGNLFTLDGGLNGVGAYGPNYLR